MKRTIEFDRSSHGIQGPIIDWCNTLHNPTIFDLELHPATPKPSLPLSVVISLSNGSRYRLQRTLQQKSEKATIIPKPAHIDTIEHVIPSVFTSKPLISIKFREGHQPNLLFILSVCYGARRNQPIFKASQIVADSDFFALAIILNVTRKCVPHRVISPTTTVSPLESLWNDVYTLIQSRGSAFWADTIAEQTKNLTRELICKSAREKIVLEMPTSDAGEGALLAAAVVARVEALGEKNELADLTLWDASWDRFWKKAWQGFNPLEECGTSVGARTMGSIVPEALKLSVDGRGPGRAAGRSLARVPLPPNVTLFHAILPGNLVPEEPVRSDKGKEVQRDEAFSKSPNSNERDSHKKTTNASETPATSHTGSSISPAIWLGQCHLIQHGNDREIWASPREIAVEMAWVAAWSKAVQQGKLAAETIQRQENNGQDPNPRLQEALGQTNASPARTGLHPGLAGAITAVRTATRWLDRVGQAYSLVTGTNAHEQEPPITSLVTTLMPHHPRILSGPLRAIQRNSMTEDTKAATETPPISLTPLHSQTSLAEPPQASRTVALQEISFTEPHPKLRLEVSQANEPPSPSTTPPRNRRQVSLPEDNPETPNHQRNRSEDARSLLRERMLTRKLERRRESEDIFRERVRERRYREKKEDAQIQAKHDISSMLNEARPSKEELVEMADEAWERTMQLSGNLMHHIDRQADQEWYKISTGRNLITSQILPNDSERWKRRFKDTWKKAWKDSWASAWNATRNQAWHTAVAKGVEFGVELALLGQDPDASRNGYKQLLSKESYHEVVAIINKADISQIERLERILSMMKELYSLYESFQHSIPAIRDNCMEIIVWEVKKVKSVPPLASGTGSEETPTPKSYFQLQTWIEAYISQKSGTDMQLKQHLKRLFIRGMAEVWDSASSVYNQENLPLSKEEVVIGDGGVLRY